MAKVTLTFTDSPEGLRFHSDFHDEYDDDFPPTEAQEIALLFVEQMEKCQADGEDN